MVKGESYLFTVNPFYKKWPQWTDEMNSNLQRVVKVSDTFNRAAAFVWKLVLAKNEHTNLFNWQFFMLSLYQVYTGT